MAIVWNQIFLVSLHLQLLLHYEKKMHFALLDKVIFMTFKPYSSLAYHCSKNQTKWNYVRIHTKSVK